MLQTTTPIEIDFYGKGNDVLIILTGIGGTTKGFENKYETIAKQIMRDYGFSVAVATTPSGSWMRLDGNNLQDVIEALIEKKHHDNFIIYAMGISMGANIVLSYAHHFPQIKKVLAINPVVNINLHKIFKGIELFTGEKIDIVFGEKDPSSQFANAFPQVDKLQTTVLPNIDHYFKGYLQTFIDLPNRFLFNNK